MVGNAAPPPSNEPHKPATWWDLIKAIGALIGLALLFGTVAIVYLLYSIGVIK